MIGRRRSHSRRSYDLLNVTGEFNELFEENFPDQNGSAISATSSLQVPELTLFVSPRNPNRRIGRVSLVKWENTNGNRAQEQAHMEAKRNPVQQAQRHSYRLTRAPSPAQAQRRSLIPAPLQALALQTQRRSLTPAPLQALALQAQRKSLVLTPEHARALRQAQIEALARSSPRRNAIPSVVEETFESDSSAQTRGPIHPEAQAGAQKIGILRSSGSLKVKKTVDSDASAQTWGPIHPEAQAGAQAGARRTVLPVPRRSVSLKIKRMIDAIERSATIKPMGKLAKEQALMEWCRQKLAGYKNVSVNDFTSSWENGLAFCALLHSYLPERIPYDTLTARGKKRNFKIAFAAAEAVGIPISMGISVFVRQQERNKQDSFAVMEYVKDIRKHFQPYTIF